MLGLLGPLILVVLFDNQGMGPIRKILEADVIRHLLSQQCAVKAVATANGSQVNFVLAMGEYLRALG